MPIDIREGGLDDPRVSDLVAIHSSTARAHTGRGSAHALDITGLRSADIRLWTAWDGTCLVGIAALKRLAPSHGEIKSMHIVETVRRQGVGAALLRHVLSAAKGDGMNRVSLETGSWPYFLPARAFYMQQGFTECGPFGDYLGDPNSVFMTLLIDDAEAS